MDRYTFYLVMFYLNNIILDFWFPNLCFSSLYFCLSYTHHHICAHAHIIDNAMHIKYCKLHIYLYKM